MFGKGLACVRGFPVEQHSIEDLERIYWAFCTHLGYLVSNNSFGHRMVRVQEEVLPNGVQPARGTKSRAELAMHNDAADILSLLCVYPAARGRREPVRQWARGTQSRSWPSGPTCSASSTKAFRTTAAASSPTTSRMSRRTTYRCSPQIDGRICINFTYSSILPAMHTLGREFTPSRTRRSTCSGTCSSSSRSSSGWSPAKPAVANNFAMCHSRSDFVSSTDPKKARCFLRAWMEVPLRIGACRIGREYFHMENKDLRLGYDVVEGRDGTIARNDYKNVDASTGRHVQGRPGQAQSGRPMSDSPSSATGLRAVD